MYYLQHPYFLFLALLLMHISPYPEMNYFFLHVEREIGGLKSTSLEKIQQELEEEKKRNNELLKRLQDVKKTPHTG